MAFDLSNVLKQANEATSSGNDPKYKIFYPGVGQSKLKLLFNPKSNSLMRLINRHEWMDKRKVPCLKTLGRDIECPICKAIEDVKNIKGIDLSRHKSKVRGIAFAQLVSTNYTLTGKNSPSTNEIVLFMFPWTVYGAISQVVTEAQENPSQLEQLIASNEGFTFTINHGEDNKYNCMMSPFGKHRTCGSDEEFERLLNSLDSLNDMIIPQQLKDEQMDAVRKVADEIRLKYLNDSSTPQTLGQTANAGSSDIPASDRPPCFGKHDDPSVDANQCLVCPSEIDCQSASQDIPF